MSEFHGIKKKLKNEAGRICLSLFPQKLKKYKRNPEALGEGLFARFIMEGLLQEAISRRDYDSIARYHQHLWVGNKGIKFYRNTSNRFNEWFLRNHASIVDEIEKLINQDKGKYSFLYEIGCGAGQVINCLCERLRSIDFFIGIDLNLEIINENRKNYISPKLTFVAADAASWIQAEGKSNAIFLTNGGVLEYFAYSQLMQILSKVSSDLRPSAWAIIEPIAANYSLEEDVQSRLWGDEATFSHNYKHLFERNDFGIRLMQETMTDGWRFLLMLATAD